MRLVDGRSALWSQGRFHLWFEAGMRNNTNILLTIYIGVSNNNKILYWMSNNNNLLYLLGQQ